MGMGVDVFSSHFLAGLVDGLSGLNIFREMQLLHNVTKSATLYPHQRAQPLVTVRVLRTASSWRILLDSDSDWEPKPLL